MRAVLNKRRSENVNGLLNKLGYLTVDREIKRYVLTSIYRVENNMLPRYLKCLVSRNRDVHGYVTRQMEQFHIEGAQSSKGQRTIRNQGIQMHNRLPTEIKEAGSVGQFREAVDKWLKDMNYVIFQ